MTARITPLVIAVVLWRLFLCIPLYVGQATLSYRHGYEYTNIWGFIQQYIPVSHILLYPWANFDGVHYLTIAGNGYTTVNARFFPLFPIVIHVVSSFFGGGPPFGRTYFFTAFFLANICFLLSLFFFYKLVRFDYPFATAFWSIIFLLVFPTSFFFIGIYAESLFLLLSLLAFYFARKRQWVLASIFGLLLSLTRIVGISILPILLYEFFKEEHVLSALRKKDKKEYLELCKKSIALFCIPFGIMGFAVFNFIRWGNTLYFVHAQGDLGNGRSTSVVVLFPQTIFRYFKILTTVSVSQYEWWIALLEIVVFFVVSLLLYIGWKKGIRFSYILFAILCFLIPVSTGTFSGLPRYSAVLFPLFITLALLKSKIVKATYFFISLILLFLLLLLFSRGYYIS